MAHLLEDYAEDEAAGTGGARARLDAALALVAKRLGPDDTARAKRFLDTGDLLEDYAEDEAAGAGGARARLDAALALVAKRLGPDDTARAKQFLDADLAACARLLLDKLYDRHLGRRGDAVLAVGPRTPPTPTPSTPSS